MKAQDKLKTKIRLSKILSHSGVCSRREAENLIKNGHVNVNGSVAVYNTVGIDIKAINGHYNAFYGKKSTNGPYYGIPVETNW